MRWNELKDEPCPVARAVSVIGDRWSILIIRDCFRNVTRFEEFLRRTGASRAIISERLSDLVEAGVLTRVPYEQHPPRHEYRLTPKGRALGPALMMLSEWGETHVPKIGGATIRRRHTRCGHMFRPKLACSECGGLIHAGEVDYPEHQPAK